MTEIVLFHSVLGVQAGVTSAAKRLEEAGHKVHIPNLYADGEVFDDYEVASQHVNAIGYPELVKRTRAAVAGLPDRMVYGGFSNGASSAEFLAATRPGALGVVLFHGAEPLESFGEYFGEAVEAWPAGVPVQVHYSANDPFREQEWLDEFAKQVKESGSAYDFYEYPGDGHLFADESRPAEYDKTSADLMWSRVLEFLSVVA